MKMKQWICPGVTRKKYLELCMNSLVFGKWVVEASCGIPVVEAAEELAKGYRLPRQFQNKEEATAFARECLLLWDYAENEISVFEDGDNIWVKGREVPGWEAFPDEQTLRVYCISDQTKDRISKSFQAVLGLID